MAAGPRIIFDTSGINKLEDGGFTSEPLMRALECGYEVILTAMSADEIISTKSPVRRDALLSRLGGCCTEPSVFGPRMKSSACLCLRTLKSGWIRLDYGRCEGTGLRGCRPSARFRRPALYSTKEGTV